MTSRGGGTPGHAQGLIKGLGAIVMAAGMGTRMRSARAKVLHPVADRPMLLYAVDLAERLAERGVSVVVGYQGDQVRRILKASSEADLLVVDQIRQLGTGHAVMQARAAILQAHGQPADTYVILNGDTPLLKEATLRRLVQQHEQHRATVTILTTILRDPSGYGRVVRKRDEADQDPDGRVMRIVEDRDAQGADVHLREINVGTYVVSGSFLFDALDKLEPKNAQQEYYLTDIVALAVDRGFRVSALMADNPDEGLGINTRAQLAAAERLIRQDICARWMEAGVTIQDPATTVIGAHVQIGRDTVLHPRVTLEGRTIIGEECVLRSQVRVADSTLGRGVVVQDSCVIQESRIDDDSTVGPFAHLRPGTVLHRAAKVGNFVELKKTELGSGSKANHLSYLGDARIGKGVNIGAGTITCNYDGMHKFETVIEDDVFVGSDSQLVAPVTIGRGSIVAAGTTVTKDVPTDGLAIARVPQVNQAGWAARRRALPPLATGPKLGGLADHLSGKSARTSTAGANAKSIPKGNAPRAAKPVVRARPMTGSRPRGPSKSTSENQTTGRRQSRSSR